MQKAQPHQRNSFNYVRASQVLAFAIGLSVCGVTLASAQSETKGFIEDSHLDLISRNFYFYRDFRNGARNNLGANSHKPVSERNGYRSEWAQGFMSYYRSGFTQGTVGFGIDAFAMLGLKLDGGGGTTGTSLLPWGADGEPETEFTKIGGAVKMQLSNTVIKYGDQITNVPVFSSNQVRLLPSTATGFSLISNEIANLTVQGGHFTAVSSTDSSHNDGEISTDYTVLPFARSIDYFGGTYKFTDKLSVTAYGSQLKDIWHQYYGNATYVMPLSGTQALSFNFNIYDTSDYGSKRGGEIENTSWSILTGYTMGSHKISVGYQMIDGDEPFDWAAFERTQSGGVYLTNAANVVPFSEPNERSWQLRYDLDMAAYGVPGLTFMTRYIRGDGMDNSHSTNEFYRRIGNYDSDAKENKEWERNIEAAYVVQSGAAKNLLFRVRHSTHRATTGTRWPDHDEVRVIVEYPLSIF